MKVVFLSNEYPPVVYGGAGVHVNYLARELSNLVDVEVRCFGPAPEPPPGVKARGYSVPVDKYDSAHINLKSLLSSLTRCVDFNIEPIDADLVHCHTWYSHFGGIIAKMIYGIPLVVTTHSLEPLRPWKREQLGNAYDFTCWIEKSCMEMADAVIAVSEGTRIDILNHFDVDPHRISVIHNGIDAEEYSKGSSTDCFEKYGILPDKPYVLFMGRITRQKGIIHLVNAAKHISEDFQLVLCAGAPDTEEIGREMKAAVAAAAEERSGIVWIDKMVNKKEQIELYSNAEIFCCPSVYEPFGIINLEAMACETAVVASAVGGIKEVVVHEETGLLVDLPHVEGEASEPRDPQRFERELAAAINRLIADPGLRRRMAEAGRQRVESIFSWNSIARQTFALYSELIHTCSR